MIALLINLNWEIKKCDGCIPKVQVELVRTGRRTGCLGGCSSSGRSPTGSSISSSSYTVIRYCEEVPTYEFFKIAHLGVQGSGQICQCGGANGTHCLRKPSSSPRSNSFKCSHRPFPWWLFEVMTTFYWSADLNSPGLAWKQAHKHQSCESSKVWASHSQFLIIIIVNALNANLTGWWGRGSSDVAWTRRGWPMDSKVGERIGTKPKNGKKPKRENWKKFFEAPCGTTPVRPRVAFPLLSGRWHFFSSFSGGTFFLLHFQVALFAFWFLNAF